MEKLKNQIGLIVRRGLAVFGILVAVAGCNGNSQTASTATVATTGYYIANGVCYQSGTTTAVAAAYCTTTSTTTTTTTGYYMVNGVCYSSATGAVMTPAATYCGTTSAVTTGSACYGTYYDPRVGQWGQCNGTNCHGVYLYTQAGALVYCP